MPIELAGMELHRVHKIVTLEQAAFVHHAIPGLDGTLVQDVGRDAVRLQIEGIFYGAQAQKDLETLRKAYLKREPVDLLAEIIGQIYFGQVTLEHLAVRQLAHEPDQYSYTLIAAEHVGPSKPAAPGGSDRVDRAIKDDAKKSMDAAAGG